MFYEIEGMQINTEIEGSGPPLVILGGWGCEAAVYAAMSAHFAPRYTVYRVELPGHGRSDLPPAPFGAADFARVTIALLEKLGISRPVLVGHSNGGRTILQMVGRMGYEADRILLTDAAGLPVRRSLWSRIRTAAFKTGKWFILHLWPKSGREQMMHELRSIFGSDDYKAAPPVMRQTLVKLIHDDLTDALPAIRVPTLLIWGEKDDATPLYQAQAMEKLIPDAGLVTFEGCGHFPFLEQPGRFLVIADSFLS